jgi:biotin carboxylase
MDKSQNLATARETGDDHLVNRNVLIRLLVTEAEKRAIQESADREGLTLSEWVRQRCFITTTTVQIKDVDPSTIWTPPSRANKPRNKAAAKKFADAKKGGR